MKATLILAFFVSLIIVLGVLVTVAFLTLIERKLIASTQNRKGPNVVGPLGILQPFADALKLLIKEAVMPRNAKLTIFIVAPLVSLFFALLSWAFIPFSYTALMVDINIAVFFIFSSSTLHVYGIVLAGWASGSKYGFIGALRSTAQLIAYDISIAIIISSIALYPKSLNLLDIVEFQDKNGWFIFYLTPLFFLFLLSSLAETNRHPFDLPEAESELVAGYFTEHSSSYFAYFFLGEYSSILLMVFLINHLFLGGWTCPITFFSTFLYLFKILLVYYFFLAIRAAIPRYRYDQLMRLGWKFVLPLSLFFFFLNMLAVVFFIV